MTARRGPARRKARTLTWWEALREARKREPVSLFQAIHVWNLEAVGRVSLKGAYRAVNIIQSYTEVHPARSRK